MSSISGRGRQGIFFLRYRFQTGSETHPAYNPVGTGDIFLVYKAAEAWSWPITSM